MYLAFINEFVNPSFANKQTFYFHSIDFQIAYEAKYEARGFLTWKNVVSLKGGNLYNKPTGFKAVIIIRAHNKAINYINNLLILTWVVIILWGFQIVLSRALKSVFGYNKYK